MVLVIEGTGDKRHIVSVGRGPYTLTVGQEIRTISDEAWLGWRKSEIHWDEPLRAIMLGPVPLTPEKMAAKIEVEAEARLIADKRILRAIEIIVREIEYLRSETKPRRPEFQALIDKLLEYRG